MRNTDRQLPQAPWELLPIGHPDVTAAVVEVLSRPGISDVDAARILTAARRTEDDPELASQLRRELHAHGSGALTHPCGQRNLPGPRLARHNLPAGQVRLGQIVLTRDGDPSLVGDYGLDHDTLATSLLVVGPPGSGTTRNIALPIIEHLSLSALANCASVIVLDTGTECDRPGWYDLTIDPLNPAVRLDLYNAAPSPHIAADRLAQLLLADSGPSTYERDVARTALYACLGATHAVYDRWPTIGELLNLLRGDPTTLSAVTNTLPTGDDEWRRLLTHRVTLATGSSDPAAGLIERLTQLDRPIWRTLFDDPTRPKFDMEIINQPLRVRIALPQTHYPEMSHTLTRLITSQFITTATHGNDDILKCLIINHTGTLIDDHIAVTLPQLRAHNAGIVLLTHTLTEIPDHLHPTVFSSFGGKAILDGLNAGDVDIASSWFGSHETTETSFGHSYNHSNDGITITSTSRNTRLTRKPRWAPEDINHLLTPHHALITLTRRNGERSLPTLVKLDT